MRTKKEEQAMLGLDQRTIFSH